MSQVQILPPVHEDNRTRGVGRNGSILFEIESIEPDRRLVTRIADESLPFGGTSTYELTLHGDSTTLRITENGKVYNPIFRFVSRFVTGYTATIDDYLNDLGKRVGHVS